MKKSSFTAMIMGTIGGILFAIGMCMCLLPEWDAFRSGVIMGGAGAAVLLATAITWRVMSGKKSNRPRGKTVGITLLGTAGALMLGVGMCFAMVWGNMIIGILIGIAGIVVLLSLIPMIKGFTKPAAEEVQA